MRNRILLLLALTLLTAGAAPSSLPLRLAPPDKPSSTDEHDVADVLNRASAVALAEVISIVEENHMPADGPLEHAVKLRIFSSSGEPSDRIDIILAWAPQIEQFPPATQPQPPARVPLSPNPLIVGQRYWFAWSSVHEMGKYPNHVLAWWPEDAAPVKALEDAVRTNRYQWQPQYEPTTGRRYGHHYDEKANTTTLRVWTGDKVLWETTLPGNVPQFSIAMRVHLGLPAAEPPGSGMIIYNINSGSPHYLDFDTGKPIVRPAN